MEKSNKEEWQQLITTYRASGLSAIEWCKHNQISVHKLRYWITKLNKAELKDESAQQWIAVQTISTLSPAITVKIGNAEISVTEGFNKDLFSEVVQSLLSIC